MNILLALIVVLQVADVITTNGALKNGAYETNRLIQWTMRVLKDAWWVPKLIVALFLVNSLRIAAPQYPGYAEVSAFIVMAIYAKIVETNYRLWKR